MSSTNHEISVSEDTPNHITNYTGLPNYIDEPTKIQRFTHESILRIGHKMDESLRLDAQLKLQQAVKESIDSTRELCEKEKEAVLQKLLRLAEAEKERMMINLQQAHQRDLNEECLRIESKWKAWAEMKLQKEKEENVLKVEAAVKEVKASFNDLMKQEIEKARIDERDKSIREQERIRIENENKMRKERERAMKDKEQSLTKLKFILNDEKDAAVAAMKIEEQQMAASELAVIISEQARKMVEYEEKITALQQVIEDLKNSLTDEQNKQNELMIELNNTRLSFKQFLETVKHFNKDGQSDFILDKGGVCPFIPRQTEIPVCTEQ